MPFISLSLYSPRLRSITYLTLLTRLTSPNPASLISFPSHRGTRIFPRSKVYTSPSQLLHTSPYSGRSYLYVFFTRLGMVYTRRPWAASFCAWLGFYVLAAAGVDDLPEVAHCGGLMEDLYVALVSGLGYLIVLVCVGMYAVGKGWLVS
jgi:hypothetical protein